MKIQTRYVYPYMYLEAKLPEIDALFSEKEIDELISEFEDLLDTLKWAKNAVSN